MFIFFQSSQFFTSSLSRDSFILGKVNLGVSCSLQGQIFCLIAVLNHINISDMFQIQKLLRCLLLIYCVMCWLILKMVFICFCTGQQFLFSWMICLVLMGFLLDHKSMSVNFRGLKTNRDLFSNISELLSDCGYLVYIVGKKF